MATLPATRYVLSAWRLAWLSWSFFWRSNVASLAGVAIGVAVLTGALVVGDSVRSSLRRLALDRLGDYQYALVADRFLREELVLETAQRANLPAQQITSLVMYPKGTVEALNAAAADKSTGADLPPRANGVVVYGVDPSFWTGDDRLASRQALGSLTREQVILNEPLARDLGVQVGDRVVVRLATPTSIPADSPLARKRDRLRSLGQLEVADIVPARGLGRFTLFPSHQAARLAFVSRQLLQTVLQQEGRVNGVLVRKPAADGDRAAASEPLTEQLNAAFLPTLADYGLTLEHQQRNAFGAPPADNGADVAETPTTDFWQITSDRMIFAPEVAAAIERAWSDWKPEASLTYLANGIGRLAEPTGDAANAAHRTSVPYSMVTAVDPRGRWNPARRPDGSPRGLLADDEIILNRWTAEDLGVVVGDQVTLRYFAPETTHGVPQEQQAPFRLVEIVDLTEPVRPYTTRQEARFEQPLTAANDPWLTPVVPGVTDQDSIADWDPPFPFDHSQIKPADDDYWKNHRTTPKAIIALSAGQRIWRSRFGEITAYRVAGNAALTRDALERTLLSELRKLHPTLGLAFRDVRSEAQRAARGTTPFDVLFLLFSMFIIGAALILLVLLFRLAIEQRTGQLGLWKACGATQRYVRNGLAREAALTVLFGSLLGVLLGIGYAALIVHGLRTWWVAAITTPFVELRLHPLPLALGALSGGVAAWFTLVYSARSMAKVPPMALLRGSNTDLGRPVARAGIAWYPLGLWCCAVVVGLLGAGQQNEAQAGAFLASGALVLAGLLWAFHGWLRRRSRTVGRQFGFAQLAFSATQHDPTRTTLTVALTAWAAFLVVAVSLFRITPTDRGTGGLRLWAISDQPIFADLNDEGQRQDVDPALAHTLRGATIYSFRLHDGEDASCRNLYRTMRPRVLGVPDAFIARYDGTGASPAMPTAVPFTWGASTGDSPWEALRPDQQAGNGEQAGNEEQAQPIPVILDQNTAMYALQLYGGIGQEFDVDYGDGRVVRFRIAGLLANSLLQGSLLVHESQLLKHFPETGGYQYFLIDCPAEQQAAVTQQLEASLSDEGLAVRATRDTLAELLAVQNTYLSSFQSLGGLGLMLGTLGLAAVQLRSVLRRQAELSLLAALGFTRTRLRHMVLWESLSLLALGLLSGTLAAVIAVTPHAQLTGTAFPAGTLIALLGTVLTCGTLASWFATRSVLSLRLLDALRSP